MDNGGLIYFKKTGLDHSSNRDEPRFSFEVGRREDPTD